MEYAENIRRFICRIFEDENLRKTNKISLEDADGALSAEATNLGLITVHDGYIVLTEKGRTAAIQTIRRHRLAERLLSDVLVVSSGDVHEHACRFEQALAPGVEEAICILLGHPRYCPHGRAIPQGTCCMKKEASVRPVVVSMAEMKPGESGHIAYIYMHQDATLQKLVAMGLFPGTGIRLLNRAPSFIFEAGNSRFAVDEEIANCVFVRGVSSTPTLNYGVT